MIIADSAWVDAPKNPAMTPQEDSVVDFENPPTTEEENGVRTVAKASRYQVFEIDIKAQTYWAFSTVKFITSNYGRNCTHRRWRRGKLHPPRLDRLWPVSAFPPSPGRRSWTSIWTLKALRCPPWWTAAAMVSSPTLARFPKILGSCVEVILVTFSRYSAPTATSWFAWNVSYLENTRGTPIWIKFSQGIHLL